MSSADWFTITFTITLSEVARGSVGTLVGERRQQSQQLVHPQPVNQTNALKGGTVGPEEGRQPGGERDRDTQTHTQVAFGFSLVSFVKDYLLTSAGNQSETNLASRLTAQANGVKRRLMTSSVTSCGQSSCSFFIAGGRKKEDLADERWNFFCGSGWLLGAQKAPVLTTESPSASLQCDAPRKIVPSLLLHLLLPERGWEHAAPEEEEASEVELHHSCSWTNTHKHTYGSP